MSRFYGSMQGSRGEATRQGTPNSGIHGHIRGWNAGVKVCVSDVDGVDVFTVYKTGGSNGHSSSELIARFTEGDTPTNPAEFTRKED